MLVLPGNQVRSGGATPLLVIHQTHPIYTLSRAPVPAAQPLAAEYSRGTLSFVDNAVDTTTGTVMLKASFPNTDGILWVGQFVAATLQLYVEQGAMVVPTPSVVTGQRGTYVYVIDDSKKDSLKVRQRPVTVARTAGQRSIISSGLSDGERVVTDGQSRLTPGAPVEIRTGMEMGSGGKRGKGGPPDVDGGKAGLAFSQFVTLFVTPVIYTYLDELQGWFALRKVARVGAVVTHADGEQARQPAGM